MEVQWTRTVIRYQPYCMICRGVIGDALIAADLDKHKIITVGDSAIPRITLNDLKLCDIIRPTGQHYVTPAKKALLESQKAETSGTTEIKPFHIKDRRTALIAEYRKFLKEVSYTEYLKSDHWKKIRTMKLATNHDGCMWCKGKDNLQVHHRTYETRGNESMDDLVVVCRRCHARFHGKEE